MRTGFRGRAVGAMVALLLTVTTLVAFNVGRSEPSAGAAVLSPGFSTSTVFTGLNLPTSFQFAPDGHVFVAEKDGVVKVFDSLNDTTPTVFADLRSEVYSYVDRGLLSLAVDPQWPARPYVYVLYAYDHILGDPSPAPKYNDTCAGTGSGVDNGNCVASARLSRLTATVGDLDHMAPGGETVLVEDWCQQFPIHINGTVAFGSDGALYASHGSAGSAHFTDYGQTGIPAEPVRRPAGPGRRHADDPDGGGWRAALAGPADAERSVHARRHGHPRRPGHRRGPARATRCSRAPTRTRVASSPTGCACRSGSLRVRAPTSSGSATSARTSTRRSTASRSAVRSSTAAGRVTRPAASTPTTRPSTSARTSSTRDRARCCSRTGSTRTCSRPSRVTRARPVRRRRPVSRSTAAGPTRPGTTARCSWPTTRGSASS